MKTKTSHKPAVLLANRFSEGFVGRKSFVLRLAK